MSLDAGSWPLAQLDLGFEFRLGHRHVTAFSQCLYYYSDVAKVLLTYSMVQSPSLTGLQLVKKFPAFHGTRRFITALTFVRHLSLSWDSPIQSIYPHSTSWRSILILSTHLRLGLPSGLVPSGFPTKTLYTTLSSPIRATCPAHLILLDFITRTILDEEYRYCHIQRCHILGLKFFYRLSFQKCSIAFCLSL